MSPATSEEVRYGAVAAGVTRLRSLDDLHPISKAGTFFAIHNLAMQGTFEREILPHIGLPHRVFQHVHGIELHGKVNYLKAGAEFATIVGTHSPSHAQRIQEIDRVELHCGS